MKTTSKKWIYKLQILVILLSLIANLPLSLVGYAETQPIEAALIDLSGKTANDPIQESNLLIREGNSFVPYNKENHTLQQDSEVRLQHKINLADFLEDPQTSQTFKDLVNEGKAQTPPAEFTYTFNFTFDAAFNIGTTGQDRFTIRNGTSSEIYGECQLTADPQGGSHQWQVTLKSAAFYDPTVDLVLEYTRLFNVASNLPEELLLYQSGTKRVTIPAAYQAKDFTITKEFTWLSNNVDSTLDGRLLEATTQIDPCGLVLKNLKLGYWNDTNDTNGNRTAGILYPSKEDLAYIKDHSPEGCKSGLTITTDSGKLLQEGVDYVTTAAGTERKDYLEIHFKAPVKELLTIKLIALTKPDHAVKTPIRATVKATAADLSEQRATAERAVAENSLSKSGRFIGHGLAEWTVTYQRKEAIAHTLVDTLTNGTYATGTLKGIQDVELNKDIDKSLWKLTPDTIGGFELSISPELPLGRYRFTYRSVITNKGEEVTNQITLAEEPAVTAQDQVHVQNVNLSQKFHYYHLGYKSMDWLVTSEVENPNNEVDRILLRSGNANDGLHYFLDTNIGNFTGNYGDAGQLWTYVRKKGVAAFYWENNRAVEISHEEFLSFHVNNNVTPDTSGSLGLTAETNILDENGDTISLWSGSRAGFQLALPAKYCGRIIYTYISSKYGGVSDIKPQGSDDPTLSYQKIWKNHVEVLGQKQSADESWETVSAGNVATDSTKYVSGGDRRIAGIILRGNPKPQTKTSLWQSLGNLRAYPIRAGDSFVFTPNQGTPAKPNAQQYLTAENLKNVKVMLMDGDPANANTGLLYENYKHTQDLSLEAGDYSLTPIYQTAGDPTSPLVSLKVTINKELGPYAVAVECLTSYRLPKEPNLILTNGNYRYNLFASVTQHTARSKDMSYQRNDHYHEETRSKLSKIALNYDEEREVMPWRVTYDPGQQGINSLNLTDMPDTNQAIIRSSIKAYYGKKKTDGTYEKDSAGNITPDLSKPVPENTFSCSVHEARGFTLDFAAEKAPKEPIIVTYDAFVTVDILKMKNTITATVDEETPLSKTVEGVRDKIGNGQVAGRVYSIMMSKTNEAGVNIGQTVKIGAGFTFRLEEKITSKDGTTTWVSLGEEEINESNQALTMRGLAAGTYRIKETKTPAGYTSYPYFMEFVIDDDNSDATSLTYSDDQPTPEDPAATTAEINRFYQKEASDRHLIRLTSIAPSSSFSGDLPQTGGPGLIIWRFMGVICLGLAALYWQKTKRNE